ncbi:hypothetical protein JHK85_025501 [Glycine max]|nr:hypothetical protein JHK85_025501 [Glycine max]
MLDYLCKGIFAYLPFSFIVANHCYYPPFNLLCRGATLELLDPLLVPSNPLGVLLNFNFVFDPLQPTTPSYTIQHHTLFLDHHLLIITNSQQQKLHELECPLTQTNSFANGASQVIDLQGRNEVGHRNFSVLMNQTTKSWDRVAYEATLDGDTMVVFVKGSNLQPHKISNPTRIRCHFELQRLHKDNAFLLTTRIVSMAQEVVRCMLPQSIRNNPNKAQGILVTVSYLGGNVRHPFRVLVPSMARVSSPSGGGRVQKRNRKDLLNV